MYGYKQNFELDSAIACVAYVLKKKPGISQHQLAKVLYGADKHHLEHYGSLMFGETYIKMKYGPVPSHVYDGVKVAAGQRIPQASDALSKSFRAVIRVSAGQSGKALALHLKADPNWDDLSEAMIESLDMGIKQFGELGFRARTDRSHDAAWEAATMNSSMPVESIAETLPNSRQLLEHLADPYPG